METRQQKLIREAPEKEPSTAQNDHADSAAAEHNASLRDQALKHIDERYVPKTLTPFEWEEYYKRMGIPSSHRQAASKPPEPGTTPGLLEPVAALFGRSINRRKASQK